MPKLISVLARYRLILTYIKNNRVVNITATILKSFLRSYTM